MDKTAEEIAQDYIAMGHSVTLITDIIAGNAMADDTALDKQGCVDRNVEHLVLMVAKDYWTDEDMTAVNAAITAGNGYTAQGIKMAEENIFTLDGNSYKEEDLDNQQKYLINQIKDLQAKSASLRFQLDQVSVAQSSFTNSLIASLKEKMESIENGEGNDNGSKIAN